MEQLFELKNINILVKLPNISIYPHLFNDYNDFCVYIKSILNDIILKTIKNNTSINELIFNNYIETINNKINIYSTNSIEHYFNTYNNINIDLIIYYNDFSFINNNDFKYLLKYNYILINLSNSSTKFNKIKEPLLEINNFYNINYDIQISKKSINNYLNNLVNTYSSNKNTNLTDLLISIPNYNNIKKEAQIDIKSINYNFIPRFYWNKILLNPFETFNTKFDNFINYIKNLRIKNIDNNINLIKSLKIQKRFILTELSNNNILNDIVLNKDILNNYYYKHFKNDINDLITYFNDNSFNDLDFYIKKYKEIKKNNSNTNSNDISNDINNTDDNISNTETNNNTSNTNNDIINNNLKSLEDYENNLNFLEIFNIVLENNNRLNVDTFWNKNNYNNRQKFIALHKFIFIEDNIKNQGTFLDKFIEIYINGSIPIFTKNNKIIDNFLNSDIIELLNINNNKLLPELLQINYLIDSHLINIQSISSKYNISEKEMIYHIVNNKDNLENIIQKSEIFNKKLFINNIDNVYSNIGNIIYKIMK